MGMIVAAVRLYLYWLFCGLLRLLVYGSLGCFGRWLWLLRVVFVVDFVVCLLVGLSIGWLVSAVSCFAVFVYYGVGWFVCL